VARLDKRIADVAGQFVLLRLTRMRGVNIDVFDFDYDLTWMAFILEPDETVLGRYGGRDATSADGRSSLAGLRYAMRAALATHKRHKPVAERDRKPRTAEQYPAAKRLFDRACIHCHQVYDLRRESLQASGKWTTDELWVYPLPENIGLTPEVDRGDVVAKVAADSPAARAGLQRGDRLVRVNGRAIASFADLQYALHRAPAKGSVEVVWRRGEAERTTTLSLADGWKKTDLSWRWSLRGLDPVPWVQGDDLSAAEKKELGLGAKRLAFRQGPFVSEPARQAGVKQNDVILGMDGKELEMTARQFGAYVRLNYKVGDRVRLNVLRDGKRLDLPLKLVGR
jgi:predicted metalloprotease with PDZ domain